MQKPWTQRAAEHVAGEKGKMTFTRTTATASHPDFPNYKAVFRDGIGIVENQATVFNDLAQIATEITHKSIQPASRTKPIFETRATKKDIDEYEGFLKIVKTAFSKHAPK